MSSTNPQIKSRADALIADMDSHSAAVTSVAGRSVGGVSNFMHGTFTEVTVTNGLVSAIENLVATDGVLSQAVSEVQDAIATI
jgi:hypothetical protein